MINIPGYTFIECLHTGKSTNIYRAKREADNHPVVIKVSSQKLLTEKKTQRFHREFELGQKIDSPYVVKYLELKQDTAYGMALIMEDDNSVDLTSITPASGFAEREFLAIAIQLVQGLQAIHTADIVHNDLKPSNVLIQPQTRHLKIIDFNRASTLRQEKLLAVSTQQAVGTLAYLSPEQTGRTNRHVDYRTDFYSLGVTFYQLLCGVLPFTADDALSLIHQHLAKQPQPPHQQKASLPEPLSQLILKLLEKEPENRYQSSEGLLHDLKVCQQMLQANGTIAEFKLGQQDFSSNLTLSEHLYGRETESHILKQTFEQVSQGSREVLMVGGQPGVGKSKLIQELQQPITLKNGYFLQGKFDQMNKNVAYSAISQAFDGLIKQLLAEDEASVLQWKEKLQKALGAHVQLIVQIVPTLARLIEEPQLMVSVEPSQAKTVFNLAFLEFIKALAKATHPLVIFLDDLQWVDNTSLELMTYLLTQPSIHHLLWLGAYRDTEVSAAHPAVQAITTLQEASVSVQTLPLATLSLASLQQWLADSLHLSQAEIRPLAELIHQKTAGNPFFVRYFLQSLYDQQLLTFAPQIHWQWDLDKIRQYPATKNVVDLMTYQIQQLPNETQQALSIASCFGHRLALTTLQAAMAQDKKRVGELLRPALNSGFLLQTKGEIQFVHDRVQEAAYALLSDTEKAQTHLAIGRRLRANTASEQNLLFDIVAQFNQARSLVTTPQERLSVARLNLAAGQRAKLATAYEAALTYLYAGKAYVDDETFWQTEYALAFSLYKELAEIEYLNSHFEKSQALIAYIQPYLCSKVDKAELYHLRMVQKNHQSQHVESIELGLKALAELFAIRFPLDELADFCKQALAELKPKLTEDIIPLLLNAPLIVDSEKRAIFKLLADLLVPCYLVKSRLLQAVILTMMKLSLAYGGNAPESCVGYTSYGYLLCSKYQEYALGYAYGQLALQLAEKLQAPSQYCHCAVNLYNVIAVWSTSLQKLPDLVEAVYQKCLTHGVLEHASYCVHFKARILFEQGCNLTKLQQELLPSLQFSQTIKRQSAVNHLRGIQIVVANLLGETLDERNFDADKLTAADFEAECKALNLHRQLCLYYLHKAQLLYLYGYFKEALQNLKLAQEKLGYMTGCYETAIFNWYDSLTRLALYPTASSEDQQAYLQQVTENQQQMKIWADSCPENFAHKYTLVEAELAQSKNEHLRAAELYAQAVELAGQQGFIQEQALAAERAAKFWLARNDSRGAQGYLYTAFTGYKQWGAKRKVAQFKAQYAELLQSFAPELSQLEINPHTTLSDHALKSLDIASIIKASEVIYKEIKLDKLLHNIMQLIVKTAGAQTGALLFVEPDDALVVKAEYAEDGTITTLQDLPLTAWSGGAQNVIQYVKYLQQPLVLDDAGAHEQFKDDAYIKRTEAKSILCLPILQQQRLIAVLYIENNLLTQAFTPERMQTLQILTAPMAIALDNARNVAEQLTLKQERQEALNKAEEERIRKEEAQLYQQRQKEFTDTVCHELRNPLQGLSGSTDSQKEGIAALEQVVTKLKVLLNAEQLLQLTTHIKTCKENVENIEECTQHLNTLLNDVLNLSKLEAQKMELDLRAIQPRAVIDSVVKIFKAKFAAKKLILDSKLPEEDIIVKVDAPRLKQILINLVANALKFTEQGGVTIELKVQPSTVIHTRLQFTVSDTGIGMTKEQQSRLFQRFSQASANIATEYGGTGLGLEISDKLVKLMGGQIKVESEEGKGSQFSFAIDCEKPALEEVKAITPLPTEDQMVAATPKIEPARTGLSLFLPARREASSSARKIMVAEDTPLNQKILANFMKKLGYETVVLANNGQEAVDSYVKAIEEESPVHLIFMDISMPVLDGNEATRQIRQLEQAAKRPAIPIIGCTGHTDEAAKQQALAAGMNDVLVKPFRKEQIQQLLEKWLTPSSIEASSKVFFPS